MDTHIHRITRRLGWVPQKANPDKVHEILQPLVPDKVHYRLHVNLIRFGREICIARAPRCEVCPLDGFVRVLSEKAEGHRHREGEVKKVTKTTKKNVSCFFVSFADHCLSDFGLSEFVSGMKIYDLFVPQRLDDLHARGLAGREQRGQDAKDQARRGGREDAGERERVLPS